MLILLLDCEVFILYSYGNQHGVNGSSFLFKTAIVTGHATFSEECGLSVDVS